MSSINQYELLKKDGSWKDRLKYVLSLTDKNEIEKHLKESSLSSYDDLKILKNKILKDLHRVDCLKKSSSFYYDLACHLTESNNHDQYNIDAYLVPFCKYDQIIDLLSRWSLKRVEQISDLNENKNDYEKFSNYFHENNKIFDLIAKKEPKGLMNLTIEYLNQLEKHKRFLPYFIHCQMKHTSSWCNEGFDFSSLQIPRSFSIENYVRLFLALYDTCKWSSNHTIRIFEYILENRQQALKGNEDSLRPFQMYPEFTTPLSIHILSQYERNGTSSNVDQRIINYPLFLQCAISTNEQYVKQVLEWIEKRFTNEQLNVIESFLNKLTSYNMRFNLEYLSNNINSIQTIIDIAINHLQQSTYTLQIILSYGIFLLRSVEQHPNKQRKEIIQQFAKKIIKQ
ncbi:unnamed protein product [Rotaria sp. Silwood1]|nr:unnamed protein product [Rotaria sp. Silwood1]CAF1317391.1 unnamed protein product [Rotaria sp. Silwood1]CAF1320453.1 unnamed protein product [Rotaria sp. Silwood1]